MPGQNPEQAPLHEQRKADLNPDKILKIYESLGYDRNRSYPKEAIQNLLDHRANKEFQRDVADELFQQLTNENATMSKDGTKHVDIKEYNLKDFCNVYVKAVKQLHSHLDYLQDENNRLEKDIESKHEEANQHADGMENGENTNTDNADQYIHVKEGEGLKPISRFGRINPYFKVKVGDSQQQTKALDNTSDPVWDQNFSFNISRKELFADFIIMDKSSYGTDNYYGHSQYDLRSLYNQRPKTEIIKFIDQDGMHAEGTCTLSLQYVYSYQELIGVQVADTEHKIEENKFGMKDYQEDLNILYGPFNDIFFPGQKKQAVMAIGTQDTTGFFGKKFSDYEIQKLEEDHTNQLRRQAIVSDMYHAMFKKYPILYGLAVMVFIYIFFVIAISMERDMFLDQFIGLTLLSNLFIWIHFNLLYSGKICCGNTFFIIKKRFGCTGDF